MCPYLCTNKLSVFVAVHLPVLLKHTVLGTSTHEVIIALAGCKTAAHSGSGLPTMITALRMKHKYMLINLTQVYHRVMQFVLTDNVTNTHKVIRKTVAF